MIALFLLQAGLGPIGTQVLPATGCAAYLWTAERQMVAMVEPASLRVQIDGKTIDLARASADGVGVTGLPATSRYATGAVTATLEMAIVADDALLRGARVPGGTLSVEQAGKDTVVAPVAGLIGCAEIMP